MELKENSDQNLAQDPFKRFNRTKGTFIIKQKRRLVFRKKSFFRRSSFRSVLEL